MSSFEVSNTITIFISLVIHKSSKFSDLITISMKKNCLLQLLYAPEVCLID